MTKADSKAAFAHRVGVSRARITQLVAQGLPVLSDGSIDVEAGLRWMEQNLDPAKRKLNTLNGEATGEANGDGKGSFSEARRQHEWAKVQRALLRLDVERGRLVDRARACDLVFRLARGERDSWLGWPARVAALLAAELHVDPHAMQAALERHVRQHLSELAEIKPEFQ